MGIRKYFTPAIAPGLLTEYTAIMTDNTTSTGIINFDTRSIPFRTPAKIIANVINTKIKKQISVAAPLEMNEEKYPSAATVPACPVIYSNKYLITHPPITE